MRASDGSRCFRYRLNRAGMSFRAVRSPDAPKMTTVSGTDMEVIPGHGITTDGDTVRRGHPIGGVGVEAREAWPGNARTAAAGGGSERDRGVEPLSQPWEGW